MGYFQDSLFITYFLKQNFEDMLADARAEKRIEKEFYTAVPHPTMSRFLHPYIISFHRAIVYDKHSVDSIF